MTRKLVALDVDGTILHYDGSIADRVRDAIRAVVEAGHVVVLATGRSIVTTMPVAELLGLTRGHAVCSNGAVTLRLDPDEPGGYRIDDEITFDPRPVLELLRGAWHDGVIAVEILGRGYKVSAPFPNNELFGRVQVVDWEELGDEPTTRVTFRSPSASAEEFAVLAEGLGLHGVNYAVGYTAWLDINPDGVSKASALEQVRAKLDIPVADVVAVGDHFNDLEMLRWAGRGVAMGQGPLPVQDVADAVTGTVEDDGLADVLEPIAAHPVGRG